MRARGTAIARAVRASGDARAVRVHRCCPVSATASPVNVQRAMLTSIKWLGAVPTRPVASTDAQEMTKYAANVQLRTSDRRAWVPHRVTDNSCRKPTIPLAARAGYVRTNHMPVRAARSGSYERALAEKR